MGPDGMSDKSQRMRRLERILRVQAQKRLLEEWRIAHLGREREGLDAEDEATLMSLGGMSDLHALFIENKVRVLRRNEVRRAQNLAKERVARERLLVARRTEKGTERLHDEAKVAQQRQERDAALQADIEATLSRWDASFE